MSDRACVLGCTTLGVHYASCAWDGVDPADPPTDRVMPELCTGCAPVKPRDGGLLCDRCYWRLRRHFDEAADLVGHLRATGDPMKSGWNWDRDRVSSSMVDLPAPIAAEITTAGDAIVQIVAAVARFVETGELPAFHHHGLRAGMSGDEAFDLAQEFALVVLDRFDWLVNRTEVVLVADAVLTRHTGDSALWDSWSIADAMAKWPLNDRPRWAKNPCPECDLRAVRVVPSRGRTRFVCQNALCGWTGDSRDIFDAETFATPRVYDLTDPTVSDERVAEFIARARAS